MSPRKSVIETAATRTRIIECALTSASADGLDGVTIGRLAAELEMSKAGVIGHFGSKEALQLAVLETAVDSFVQRVPARVVGAPPGAQRLARAFGEWIDYIADDRRGCFLTAVGTEFGDRPGPVRDAVVAALSRWSAYVQEELTAAIESGELPRDTDPDQLAFELNGIALATAQAVQLHHDHLATARARRALARLLPS